MKTLQAKSDPIFEIFRRVGRASRIAGIGFVVLTIILLFLSVLYQSTVFEIDSVAAFLAAIVLLFRDPRARVQARVFDAVLLSANDSIGELSAERGTFTYVPAGPALQDVVVVPNSFESTDQKQDDLVDTLTPPGRGLARLFMRETGFAELTLDELSISLQRIIHESFGLANSVTVLQKSDRVEVTLHGTSAECGCKVLPGNTGKGTIGCVVGSFFAVLYSFATGRSVILERCLRDGQKGTWSIVLNLGDFAKETSVE